MRRIIVDSGSSIKVEEKDQYGVDILPISLQMGDESFLDGVNLSTEEFYRRLKDSSQFPKTSLPSLEETQKLVDFYTNQGDEVLIITISSEISGTYQAIKMLFNEYNNVTVFDSRLAVGGIRFLVAEANKYKYETMETVIQKLNQLLPRIMIAAVPETLDYLLAGGRLSKSSWMVGKLLSINPIITFINWKVDVLTKKRGIKQSKKTLVEMVKQDRADKSYGIIAAYTYNKANVDDLIQILPDDYKNAISVYDDLCSSIACHWGPNAFGFIYVKENTAGN
ncbi:MAG: DegV family protein [Lachnospiraceae bacterium]|nr:DegV family protein [Lachnospiraceae bacterium]